MLRSVCIFVDAVVHYLFTHCLCLYVSNNNYNGDNTDNTANGDDIDNNSCNGHYRNNDLNNINIVMRIRTCILTCVHAYMPTLYMRHKQLMERLVKGWTIHGMKPVNVVGQKRREPQVDEESEKKRRRRGPPSPPPLPLPPSPLRFGIAPIIDMADAPVPLLIDLTELTLSGAKQHFESTWDECQTDTFKLYLICTCLQTVEQMLDSF